jgi:hypothetical protein
MSDMGQAGQHASDAPRHCDVRVADAALMLLLIGAAETLPSRRRLSTISYLRRPMVRPLALPGSAT